MAERMYAAMTMIVAATGKPYVERGRLRGVGCAVRIERRDCRGPVGTVAMGEIGEHDPRTRPVFLGTIAAGGTLNYYSAVDQHGRLRRDDRHVDSKTLSRGVHPRLRAVDPLHGNRARRLSLAARVGRHARGDKLEARIRILPGLLPPLVILAAVIGSIYIGWRPRPRRPRSAFSRPLPTRPTSAACRGK